ncbi:MAG TPA: hypothetical protein VH596_01780 [Terriglobales bacterium]
MSGKTIATSEQQASRIFSQAGVDAVWIECPVPLRPESDRACAIEANSREVLVRLLDRPAHHYFADNVFGFTIPPVIASVYYEPISRLAASDKSEEEIPIILGCVLAHEIGHLLLGANAHSAIGIMQHDWKGDQLNLAMRGQLLFTPWQAKRVRTRVERWRGLDSATMSATESPSRENGQWVLPKTARGLRAEFGDR